MMVEDSVTGGGEEEVGEKVEELVVSSSLEVTVEVTVSESVTPVDRTTLWRFKRAMASSRGSAETAEAATSIEKRRYVSCRMAAVEVTD